MANYKKIICALSLTVLFSSTASSEECQDSLLSFSAYNAFECTDIDGDNIKNTPSTLTFNFINLARSYGIPEQAILSRMDFCINQLNSISPFNIQEAIIIPAPVPDLQSSEANCFNIYEDADNCPTVSNQDQSNVDGDTEGDACDRDSDNDGVFNTIEIAAGTNPLDSSDANEAEQTALEALGINKQVPAMGGIGLLALGLSILGLGAVRLRKK